MSGSLGHQQCLADFVAQKSHLVTLWLRNLTRGYLFGWRFWAVPDLENPPVPVASANWPTRGRPSLCPDHLPALAARTPYPLLASLRAEDLRLGYLEPAAWRRLPAAFIICLALREGGSPFGVLEWVLPQQLVGGNPVTVVETVGQALQLRLQRAFHVWCQRQLEKQIGRLRTRTVQAQEDERKLVALEIHDVIAQPVATLYYRLQVLERQLRTGHATGLHEEFGYLRELARTMVDDVTRLMFDLKPLHLEELGVLTTLRRYINQYGQENGLKIDVEVTGRWPRYHPSVELGLYRIVQEALTNVRKHARARRVCITLRARRDVIEAVVEDDGCGFDSRREGARWDTHRCLGIFSMTERAALLGGTLAVRSRPEEGTRVEVVLPALPRRGGKAVKGHDPN